jgi:hypothetical protein
MFPARQHTTSYQIFDTPLTTTTGTTFSSLHLQWQPQPLPAIIIDSPRILSESGNMKFIYRTRWDFSVPYTLHIKPSSASEASYNKYITPYPQAKLVSSDNKTTSFAFLATPKLF